MSFFTDLNAWQKASGIAFLLTKIVNIFAVCVILAAFVDKSFYNVAAASLVITAFLWMTCIFCAAASWMKEREEVSEKKGTIEELMKDPEIRNFVAEKFGNGS